MGARGPRSPPVPASCFSPFSILGSPVPSLSSRDLGEGLPQASLFEALLCPRCWAAVPPSWASVLVLTIVLCCDGGGERILSLPRPVPGGAPTSPAWDPWLCPTPAPDPAQIQMFTGSLLPTPSLSRSEAPKEKAQKA
ncbi:hypothetical protein mRhiFer1_008550 [Rhinolophus ferrumequinum]|uniref:Uncharacterized protein n=1 Tax=Rhinolophus ferrumequinum TaxID=59479 RepID=A0A7J7UJN6_RHIFE|nr:hypothetical protein mRhiFer1_008550 [Rhinolophus ferrumequinum]